MEASVTSNRYTQLDSLRGLAALTVLLGHFLGMYGSVGFHRNLLGSPLGILFNGTAAVMLFFVLSGFVLSLPYVNSNKPLMLTSFYIKRIFRIYPAFIFAIAFSLLLKYYCFDKAGMVHFSTWIKGFWMWDWKIDKLPEILRTFLLLSPNLDTHLINPPIWSLIVEMKMSLVLPFFIIITSRSSIMLNIGLLLVMGWLTYQYDNWAFSTFHSGVLLAKYKDQLILTVAKWPLWVIGIISALALVLYNNNYEFMDLLNIKAANKYIISNYIITISSCIVIVLILSRKGASWFLNRPVLVFTGNISYSLYLIHMPLLIAIGSLFSFKFAWSGAYILFSTFAVTVPLSYLMFIGIEKPFQRLGNKIISKYPFLNSLALNPAE
jgi:peptidoglycan/LPS O-acetylase OafA/YrhL